MDEKTRPEVSVIIPSLDGYRDGNVPRLLEDLKKQRFQDFEVLVIKGISPNGRARNEGAKQARGDILVFIDDDVRLGNDRVLENLVQPFRLREPIGLVGASQLIPPDSNAFQRKEARELPRTFFPVVQQLTDSDMVSHMCLAIPAVLFKQIGGENNNLVSGTDPDLRYRVRKAGYRVVVAPETWAYHPLPVGWGELVRKSYQSGYQSAWVQKFYPNLVFELEEGDRPIKKPRRSFVYRLFRLTSRLIFTLFTGRWIFLTVLVCRSWGYIIGLCTVKKESVSYELIDENSI